MKRSRTLLTTSEMTTSHAADASETTPASVPAEEKFREEARRYRQSQHRGEEEAAIVHNIASFLSFSDAASLVSLTEEQEVGSPTDSWAVGIELGAGPSWDIHTPLTPALVALSPGTTPNPSSQLHLPFGTCISKANAEELNEMEEEDTERMEELLHERRRQLAKTRLASAVFSHPRSLRSFALEAYTKAKNIRENEHHHNQQQHCPDPETLVEPCEENCHVRRKRKRPSHKTKRLAFVLEIMDCIIHNMPLSVLLHLIEATGDTFLDTTFSSFRISVSSANAFISALSRLVCKVWEGLANFNPFFAINAVGKTSVVIASGIQSVATGVGSASSIALSRLSLSTANLSANRTRSCSFSMSGEGGIMLENSNATNLVLNKKLLKKMSKLNDAARVVSYKESQDKTGGLTRQAKSRLSKMMHYDVSLRPFLATVSPQRRCNGGEGKSRSHTAAVQGTSNSDGSIASDSDSVDSSGGSPFMCTPKSFPPTPSSRHLVMARGSRFSDDVVFLARDRLRIHGALDSDNERTREMAQALKKGKRLAVFDAKDASNGIELTCGQHIVTKVGNLLYGTTRSMVPVLRNCYVYFEMTVMPRPVVGNVLIQSSMAMLSLGLSTEEMPPNTLVGSWQGSVGLCTTGQILMAGQWCSPLDPSLSSFGDRSTVGCLVCVDDGSAFETWDGAMVTAAITFNVDGVVVSPPVSTLPMTGSPPPGTASNVPTTTPVHGEAFPNGSAPHTLSLLVPAAEELYPTLTLHSPATAVMCRFSAEDVAAVSKENIGAPRGATIYAVDGSVIFEANN